MSDVQPITREDSLQTFGTLAKQLIEFLNTLPLDPQMKAFCFLNLDQSTFWAAQAINNMQLAPVEEPVEESNSEVILDGEVIQ